MVFSSPVFLFLFLPLVLALCLPAPPRLRNLLLLTASLIFYAWGERTYIAILLVSIATKYANFFADNFNVLLAGCNLPLLSVGKIHLPLGISFFTFHALSYVIDVYRGEVKALQRPVAFALYISFFPQSIAGPIIRYHDIAGQLL